MRVCRLLGGVVVRAGIRGGDVRLLGGEQSPAQPPLQMSGVESVLVSWAEAAGIHVSKQCSLFSMPLFCALASVSGQASPQPPVSGPQPISSLSDLLRQGTAAVLRSEQPSPLPGVAAAALLLESLGLFPSHLSSLVHLQGPVPLAPVVFTVARTRPRSLREPPLRTCRAWL